MNILQLKDIFRLKYPLAKSFTRIQFNPFTATRLDFFLVSEHLCGKVRETEIKASVKSDHINLYYCCRCCSNPTRTWFLET